MSAQESRRGLENLKMNESTFVYWLQGFVEIANTDTISEKQWQIIKDHLKLVFDKKTPDRSRVEILSEEARKTFDKLVPQDVFKDSLIYKATC